jgi:hypothetical protein
MPRLAWRKQQLPLPHQIVTKRHRRANGCTDTFINQRLLELEFSALKLYHVLLASRI